MLNRFKVIPAIILSLCFSSVANAGLIKVKSIEISNAINNWLQVAEVVARDMNGVDLALASSGAVASAPDWWSAGSQPINAIDGNTGGNFNAGEIFHEGSPRTGDALTITFSAEVELDTIQIFGRSDCCQERDFYSVSFFDDASNELYTTTIDSRFRNSPVVSLPDTATAVPAPATALLMLCGLFAVRARSRAA